MSDYERFPEDYGLERDSIVPRQCFDELGLDADVLGMFGNDLDAEPSTVASQNAGIMAELVVEQANRVVVADSNAGVDISQFRRYAYDALGADGVSGGHKEKLSKVFDVMCGPVVTAHEFYEAPDDTSHWGTYNTWAKTPEQVGSVVSRKLQYDAAAIEAAEVMEIIGGGAQVDPVNLRGNVDRLNELVMAMEELMAEPYDDEFYGIGRRRRQRASQDELWIGAAVRRQDVLESISSARTRLQCLEAIAGVEVESEDREKYGAKAAHLIALDKAVDGLRRGKIRLAEHLYVPEFMPVDAQAYDAYVSGEGVERTVDDIVTWSSERPDKQLIIRSSALHAEDGEHMGAGIYDSVVVPAQASKGDILAAITKVYDSVNSDDAIAYRQSIGIDNERMGLVIQELVGDVANATLMTVNSMAPETAEIVDYTIENRGEWIDVRPMWSGTHSLPLSRRGVDSEFGVIGWGEKLNAPRLHVPPDLNIHQLKDSWFAAQGLVLSELVLGGAVQVEMALDEERQMGALLQARPLPESWQRSVEFDGFPEEGEIWHEGRGVGVINGMEAMVVQTMMSPRDTLRWYPNTNVIIVCNDSFGHGNLAYEYMNEYRNLTQEEKDRLVLLVRRPPVQGMGGQYGHLETMAIEAGLRFVFADPDGFSEEFVSDQQVTVYSDGYKAKVYSSSQDPALVMSRERRERRLKEDLYDDEDTQGDD